MKILGVPKMKWHDGCCWLLLLSFSLVFALGNDNEQNISIREFPMNAIDSTTSSQAMSVVSNNAIDSAAQKQQQKSDSVEEIWAKETELAEREVERILLFGLGGSFPPPMPTGPVITPTMAPMGVTPDDCLNGRTEEQFLLDELTAITPAVDQLLNPAMPQGMAVNFILADSLVRNDVCAHPTLAQRYGLGKNYPTGYRCTGIVFLYLFSQFLMHFLFPCAQQLSIFRPMEAHGITILPG